MAWIDYLNLGQYHEKLKKWIEANKYIHPLSHPATMIVQDELNQFVTKENLKDLNLLTKNLTFTITYNSGNNAKFIDGSTVIKKDVVYGSSIPEFPTVVPTGNNSFSHWETIFNEEVINDKITKNITFQAFCMDANYIIFENKSDFDAKIANILIENNNDLSNVNIEFTNGLEDENIQFPAELIATPHKIIANKATSFENTFNLCNNLTKVSPVLFYECPKVDSFAYAFESCSKLNKIPKELFSNNKLATNFEGCFYGNSNIVEIPVGLFDNCPNAKTFYNCFSDCIKLSVIPNTLFRNNTVVRSFKQCFYYCVSLNIVPSDLFDTCKSIVDVTSCFSDSEFITSALPTVWDKAKFPNITSHLKYAYGCIQAANYAEIPSDWK